MVPFFYLNRRSARSRTFKYERGTTVGMATETLQDLKDSMRDDKRAVGGMPIRLVVAVTVGVAAMSLLLPMADSIEASEEPEVTVQPQTRQFALGTGESQSVRLAVVTEDGEPVEDATVVVSGQSLPVDDGPAVFRTGEDSNRVTITVGRGPEADVPVSFRPTQTRGTLTLDIVPPSGYTDERRNPEVTVRNA